MIFLFPIFLQGGVIFVDEFYFHRRRGLPRWERLGHPLDTLSFLLCIAFSLVTPPSENNILIYAGLSLLSCLFVTKDEFIHAEKCEAAEQWLHSVLFLLHPVSLFCFYHLWVTNQFREVLLIQAAVITAFMFYQFFYWQFFERRSHARS